MTQNYDLDDLARLHALEHIVSTIALMWTVSFADRQGGKPSEWATRLKDNVEGSVYDDAGESRELKDLTRLHLDRLLTHVVKMARHADFGA